MAKHTPQIRLCQACEQALQKMVEHTREGNLQGLYCPHHQCMGIVEFQQGTIISWSLEGPLTYEQAVAIVAQGIQDGLRIRHWQAEQGQCH